MHRRRLLAAIATALPLAGCIGGPGAGTPTPTPRTEFAVRSRECGTGEDRATVETNDGGVFVRGSIRGSDTCDTAGIDSVTRRDGELHVAVVTRRVDTPGTPVCAQCLTDIEYELRVLDAGPVDTVVVLHDGDVITRVDV